MISNPGDLDSTETLVAEMNSWVFLVTAFIICNWMGKHYFEIHGFLIKKSARTIWLLEPKTWMVISIIFTFCSCHSFAFTLLILRYLILLGQTMSLIKTLTYLHEKRPIKTWEIAILKILEQLWETSLLL